MGLVSCIVAMIELFKSAVQNDLLLVMSSDF